jgi:hypothetical protein
LAHFAAVFAAPAVAELGTILAPLASFC